MPPHHFARRFGGLIATACAFSVLAACASSPSAPPTDGGSTSTDPSPVNNDPFAQFDVPAGVELTAPGTDLKFGQSATVAVRGQRPDQQYFWTITVDAPTSIKPEDLTTADVDFGGQPAPTDIVCAVATVRWAGPALDPAGREQEVVSAPGIAFIDDKGRGANELITRNFNACDVPGSASARVSLQDLDPQRTYRTFTQSYRVDEGGIDPTAVVFRYNPADIVGGEAGDLNITWTD